MKYLLLRSIIIFFLITTIFGIQPSFAKQNKKSASKSDQLLTRIDFGNSYITGQTLKSGAVYLLQRKKSDMKTMLKYRENYRKEILDSHDIHKQKLKK